VSIEFLCVSSKYGNFTKGTVYRPFAIFGNEGQNRTFKILDDEHDIYTFREISVPDFLEKVGEPHA